MIQFDQVCAKLIQFNPIWSNLIQFIPIYSNLIKFDQVWSSLIQFDPIWSNLNQFDPIWTNFILFEPNNQSKSIEAISTDLNFQKWETKQTWQMPRSLSKQALLKLKKILKGIFTPFWYHSFSQKIPELETPQLHWYFVIFYHVIWFVLHIAVKTNSSETFVFTAIWSTKLSSHALFSISL